MYCEVFNSCVSGFRMRHEYWMPEVHIDEKTRETNVHVHGMLQGNCLMAAIWAVGWPEVLARTTRVLTVPLL